MIIDQLFLKKLLAHNIMLFAFNGTINSASAKSSLPFAASSAASFGAYDRIITQNQWKFLMDGLTRGDFEKVTAVVPRNFPADQRFLVEPSLERNRLAKKPERTQTPLDLAKYYYNLDPRPSRQAIFCYMAWSLKGPYYAKAYKYIISDIPNMTIDKESPTGMLEFIKQYDIDVDLESDLGTTLRDHIRTAAKYKEVANHRQWQEVLAALPKKQTLESGEIDQEEVKETHQQETSV